MAGRSSRQTVRPPSLRAAGSAALRRAVRVHSVRVWPGGEPRRAGLSSRRGRPWQSRDCAGLPRRQACTEGTSSRSTSPRAATSSSSGTSCAPSRSSREPHEAPRPPWQPEARWHGERGAPRPSADVALLRTMAGPRRGGGGAADEVRRRQVQACGRADRGDRAGLQPQLDDRRRDRRR